MKKILFITISVLALGSTPVFAHHGGHGGGRHCGSRSASYGTCNYADCNLDYRHYHNGTCYNAHYNGDGHTHHSY